MHSLPHDMAPFARDHRGKGNLAMGRRVGKGNREWGAAVFSMSGGELYAMLCGMSIRETFGQHRLLGGAMVLAVTGFAASFVGLIRDNLLARTFPQLGVVDVYLAAFRPSDLLFQVCIMSALGTVFVPMLASHKAHGKTDQMWQVLGGTMAIGGILFGVIALVMAVIFPWVAPYLVHFTGDQLELYIHFGRLALLTNFLFVFGNAFGQSLVTEQKYWVYGLTPVLYTLGTITGTVLLTPSLGAYGPMMGTVLGTVLFVLWRATTVFRLGFRLPKTLWHPDLSHMGILMLPRMFALGALQLQLLLFDTIASGLDGGSVTINAYSRNFQSVVVGVIGIALAQSAYSLLGQAAAKGEMSRFRLYMEKGMSMMLLLTVPAAIALMIVAPIAAYLVHLHTSAWYPAFRLCLILYAISIPFESCSHLLLRSFYSLKNTMIPATLGVLSGAVAVFIAWFFVGAYGIFALPFGYALGQIVQALGLGLLLSRTIRKRSQNPGGQPPKPLPS